MTLQACWYIPVEGVVHVEGRAGRQVPARWLYQVALVWHHVILVTRVLPQTARLRLGLLREEQLRELSLSLTHADLSKTVTSLYMLHVGHYGPGLLISCPRSSSPGRSTPVYLNPSFVVRQFTCRSRARHALLRLPRLPPVPLLPFM